MTTSSTPVALLRRRLRRTGCPEHGPTTRTVLPAAGHDWPTVQDSSCPVGGDELRCRAYLTLFLDTREPR